VAHPVLPIRRCQETACSVHRSAIAAAPAPVAGLLAPDVPVGARSDPHAIGPIGSKSRCCSSPQRHPVSSARILALSGSAMHVGHGCPTEDRQPLATAPPWPVFR